MSSRTERRWYPTLEPVADGRIFGMPIVLMGPLYLPFVVFGGAKTGDFVSR